MKELKLTPEVISSYAQFSKELFTEMKVSTDEYTGMLMGKIVVRIDAYVLKHSYETQNINYTFERPTFLDWLLRRKRNVIVKVEIKDILKNPPKQEQFQRIYIPEI